ncbi:MAG: (2Fe-2S)-binding protein [Alphaproteobacteria bacterium]|nr:(2Fe-2S)-binding protein [Alphaproteobacteria bacterium]TAD88302.1 MAG: (2Fe-2S)-binding protein [Alphaproteobacteria bacterium]
MTQLVLNGRAVTAPADPQLLLGLWLRDSQGLTGLKLACDQGVCGACTVLVNDQPMGACHLFVWQVEGQRVETIESLGSPTRLHPLQQAFHDHGALQCGFCTPGMILAALALLRVNPHPTREEVQAALSGNLCRCTGYRPIIDAVLAAAEAMAESPP